MVSTAKFLPREMDVHGSAFSAPRTADGRDIHCRHGGRVGRIDLEPGDEVKAGQVLAKFDLVPFEQAVAEAKALVAELEAKLAAVPVGESPASASGGSQPKTFKSKIRHVGAPAAN